jgi:hypothetical protein
VKIFALALILLVPGFRAGAQLITNQPARFPYKIEWSKKATGMGGNCVNPTPEATYPGNGGEDTAGRPDENFDLKWTFLGRNEGQDVYQFTLVEAHQTGTPALTTSELKDIQFDGKQMVVFDDLFYNVIIKNPAPSELASK